VVERQRQNEASVHRPAKEFTDNRKRVREWSQYYSTLNKPAECLENAAIYAVANLCQPILTIEFLKERRQIGVEPAYVQQSVI